MTRRASRSIADRFRADAHSDVVLRHEAGGHDGQILGALAGEERGELHAVVRGARLLAQHGDVERRRPLDQGFEESLTDHAVTDHDQLQSSVHPLRSP